MGRVRAVDTSKWVKMKTSKRQGGDSGICNHDFLTTNPGLIGRYDILFSVASFGMIEAQ
jgi:hypothetical protein